MAEHQHEEVIGTESSADIKELKQIVLAKEQKKLICTAINPRGWVGKEVCHMLLCMLRRTIINLWPYVWLNVHIYYYNYTIYIEKNYNFLMLNIS